MLQQLVLQMNKICKITLFFLVLFSFFIILKKEVKAGDEACTDPSYPVCMSTRIINEYSCTKLTTIRYYCGVLGQNTPVNYTPCNPDLTYSCATTTSSGGLPTTCNAYYCLSGSPDCFATPKYDCVSTGTVTVGCQTSTGYCRFVYNNYKECSVQSSGGTCSETATDKIYSCCAEGTVKTPTPAPTSPTTAPTTAPTVPPTPSCTATFNATSYALIPGGTQLIALTVVPKNGTVGTVDFKSSNTNAATVDPSSDGVSPYQTTVTASPGGNGLSSTITGTATLATGQTCSATTTINVTSIAWWQVIDSDLLTNGGIGSSVPLSYYFNLVGAGGFPGVPMFGGSTNLSNTNVSTKGWLANSNYNTSKTYNSAYFINLIPSDVLTDNNAKITSSSIDGSVLQSGGALHNGYYWYIYDGSSTGPLTVSSAVNLGSRKVILIAKNAVISFMGNVALTDGSGFFLAISSSNINISAAANSIEGIYIADGLFRSGGGATQLRVRGSVAAYGGVELTRDLGAGTNLTTPAEIFEYAPDQEMLFPIDFATRIMKWKEVAP